MNYIEYLLTVLAISILIGSSVESNCGYTKTMKSFKNYIDRGHDLRTFINLKTTGTNPAIRLNLNS